MSWKFNFHYNKPLSRQFKKVKWSVHFRGKCHIVDDIHCYTITHSRMKKRQPFAVMEGSAEQVRIEKTKGITEAIIV